MVKLSSGAFGKNTAFTERRLSILVALLWGVSFIGSVHVFAPEPIIRLASLLALNLAVVITVTTSLIRSKSETIRLNFLNLGICSFVLLASISVLLSEVFYVSFISFYIFLLFPGYLYCALNVPDKPIFYRVIAFFTLVTMVGLSLWVIYQHFFYPEFMVNGKVRHPFANPNSLAALLMFTLFLAVGGLFRIRGFARLSVQIACVILGVAYILLVSRAAIFAGLIAAVPAAILLRRHLGKKKIFIFGLLAAMASVVIFSDYFNPHNVITASYNFGNLISDPSFPVLSRTTIWMGALDMIKQAPFIGTGFGTFHLYYPEFRLAAEGFSSGLRAHNDPLQFAAEMGLLAPVLFYAVCIFCLIYMVKAMKAIPPENESRIMIVAAFFGIVSVALHSHASYNFYVPAMLCLMAAALGLWQSEISQSNVIIPAAAIRKPSRKLRETLYVLILVIVLGASYFLQGFMVSAYHIQQARSYAAAEDLDNMTVHIDKASHAAFEMNAEPYVMAAQILTNILANNGRIISRLERQGMVNQVISLLDRAENANPRISGIYLMKAAAMKYAPEKDDDAVEELLLQAFELNPTEPEARIALSDYYFENGQADKGYEILKGGLEWRIQKNKQRGFFEILYKQAVKMNDAQTVAYVAAKLDNIYRK